MKIKVTRRFIDRANDMKTREPGDTYEAPDERADFLIRLGLAAQVPEPEPEPEPAAEPVENEAVEAPEKAPEPADGETLEQAPKTAKKAKKTAK